MSFSNGYAVAVLVNGNVLEERVDGVVAIPFGADYALRLINRTGKRALARVALDGQQVTGGGIIVGPHSTVDLERPTDKPVKFRFASTESKAAEEHGKAGPDTEGDKGLVQVQWQPEKVYRNYETGYLGAFSESKQTSDYTPRPQHTNSSLRSHRLMRGGPCGQSMSASHERQTKTMSLCDSDSGRTSSNLSSGVTVEGGHSSQSFRYVSFDVDHSVHPTNITLKLKGYVAEEGVPVTGTLYCPSCRTKTKKATDNYCRKCGEKL